MKPPRDSQGLLRRRLLGPELFAWLAALIDGEGTIMVTRDRPGGTKRNRTARVIVTIANTDCRLIDMLLYQTGSGRVSTVDRHNGHKPCHQWYLNETEARGWLPALLPWLVCKEEQALLAIQLLSEKARRMPARGKLCRYDESYHSRVSELAGRIKRLNRRGVYVE